MLLLWFTRSRVRWFVAGAVLISILALGLWFWPSGPSGEPPQPPLIFTGREAIGFLDVKEHGIAHLPRAHGDGVQDDTATLQTLINFGYANRLALVFPAGVYLLSDTLHLEQTERARDRRYYSHQLLGSTQGSQPILRLHARAPGFANATPASTKPVLRFFARCAEGDDECQLDQWETARTVNFENGLHNLTIEVADGNPGAVGLSFSGSQLSFIEDVTIRLTSGFAGLTHAPGLASVVGNLTISGGEYGIYNDQIGYTNGTTFTNLTLTGQRVCSLFALRSEKTITFVGLHIHKAQPPAICLDARRPSYFSVIDGIIEFAEAAPAPAIDNPGASLVTLTNLYFRNAPVLYQQAALAIHAASGTVGNWQRLGELYVLDEGLSTPALVAGQVVRTPNPLVSKLEIATPPADLLTNHSWGAPTRSPYHLLALAEDPATSKVCNAKASPAVRGNGSYDDQPGLQALVRDPNCQTIFLPKGRYYLGNTLHLDGGVRLYGLAPRLTEIVAVPSLAAPAAPSNRGPWRPTAPTPILTTVDNASAAVHLGDLRIWLPTAPPAHDWFMAFDWRAGAGSLLKNVQIRPTGSQNFGSQPKPDVRFSGHAGGRWFGAGSLGVSENADRVSAGKRRLLVEGVQGPLVFYNYNIEDGWAYYANRAEGWQSEIVGSENVLIYGGKFEDRNGLRVKNSTNIGIFAVTNSDLGASWDSASGEPTWLWVNLGSKFLNSNRSASIETTFREQIGDTVQQIPFTDPIAVVKRGELNRSRFVFGER